MGDRHLPFEQRYQVAALREVGLADRRSIGCHPSTVGRERGRNSRRGRYEGTQAHRKAQVRRSRHSARAYLSDELLALIDGGLAQRWSPEQIWGRGLRLGERTVGYTTIYRYLHGRGVCCMAAGRSGTSATGEVAVCVSATVARSTRDRPRSPH